MNTRHTVRSTASIFMTRFVGQENKIKAVLCNMIHCSTEGIDHMLYEQYIFWFTDDIPYQHDHRGQYLDRDHRKRPVPGCLRIYPTV
jgi:hypothetical protein